MEAFTLTITVRSRSAHDPLKRYFDRSESGPWPSVWIPIRAGLAPLRRSLDLTAIEVSGIAACRLAECGERMDCQKKALPIFLLEWLLLWMVCFPSSSYSQLLIVFFKCSNIHFEITMEFTFIVNKTGKQRVIFSFTFPILHDGMHPHVITFPILFSFRFFISCTDDYCQLGWWKVTHPSSVMVVHSLL